MIPEKHSFIISTIYKLKGNVNHVSSLLLQAVPQDQIVNRGRFFFY